MSALRERKKAALRGTIVRCAVELFVERGYDAVSMEDIATTAMCSRSTLNRYFGTKEDVLFDSTTEITEHLREQLRHTDGPDRWALARDAVTAHLAEFFENVESDLRVDIMQLWFSEPALLRRYLSIVYEWETILREFFSAGLPRSPGTRLRVELLATAMSSALRAATTTALDFDGDAAVLTAEAFEYLEHGLPTLPGDVDVSPGAGRADPRFAV
ncbi:TetR/AcrR family transcriptional regulator [Actinomycetospora sp. TBRC 11914]|uniref:TetR/AcrR family transcriptional regulator n=1 Tax=Actinomycetospora sp. TBRC 11914 TaxID=2729387 RepID=UPI00145CB205|nr:TetR/AcrR family transcriptional regulator [Actinomycetospora sp. TBRC 11914]NMO91581.1 TetR/AcrR family transcriptional regulator [Actinomycetospora sp. TBRC 11914]